MYPDPQEDVANWSVEEWPQDERADLWTCGFGRKVFLKMLSANATDTALLYATCTPGHPWKRSTRTRLFGFNQNQSIGLDVKYLEDTANRQSVALSIVDVGTSWHVATSGKNRYPKHVGEIYLKEWFTHYVVSNEISVDQGDEFIGYLNESFEEHGIDSRANGAQVANDFDMKGSWNAQIWSSSIINTKNNTMTPEQTVFGRGLYFTQARSRQQRRSCCQRRPRST